MTISFSGLDGAGKTTQIKSLLEYYRSIGAKTGSIYTFLPNIRYYSSNELINLYEKLNPYDVIHMRFRLNSNRNSVIMKHLESKIPPRHILSIAAAIRGYLDYCELRDKVIKPLLENNKTIIFDRYYYDELVFKYIYGCPNFIMNILYKNVQETDIRFYIRIEAKECMHRNQSRPDSNVTIYQAEKTIRDLISRFDYIAEQKSMITIDGLNKKEDIAKEVLQYLRQV